MADEKLEHLIELTAPRSEFLATVRHYVEIHDAVRRVAQQYTDCELAVGATIDVSVLRPIVNDPSVPRRVREHLSEFYGANSRLQGRMSRANTLAARVNIDGITTRNCASQELIDHYVESTGRQPTLSTFVLWVNSHRQ